jgi:hypothetical protein
VCPDARELLLGMNESDIPFTTMEYSPHLDSISTGKAYYKLNLMFLETELVTLMPFLSLRSSITHCAHESTRYHRDFQLS